MFKSLTVLALSVSFLSPVAVLAEDTNTGTAVDAGIEIQGEAGVAVPKFINLTQEARARCKAKCDATGSDTPERCIAECVAAAQSNVISPRDAASGLPTGKMMRPGYDVKANVKARMSMTEEEREAAMEERREKMAEWREEHRAEMEKRHEALKERLAEWKDKTKAEIAARIQENLDALNQRMTAHFTAQLDKMVDLMVRIEAEADDDDADVEAAIEAANDAIAEAQEAVDDQADNTYTVETTTEATVKVDVGGARQKLHADLKAVAEKVKEAKTEVRASYDLAVAKKV